MLKFNTGVNLASRPNKAKPQPVKTTTNSTIAGKRQSQNEDLYAHAETKWDHDEKIKRTPITLPTDGKELDEFGK
jgi:hypothetical protein